MKKFISGLIVGLIISTSFIVFADIRNDDINKDIRMRTTNNSDCVIRPGEVDGPTLAFGHLLTTQPAGSNLSPLDLVYIVAEDTRLTGNLRVDGDIEFLVKGDETINLSELNAELETINNKMNELLDTLKIHGIE